MLKFISFGSGSSGNCYYLFTATDGLLIDTGIGTRTLKQYFKDYGLSLSSVHHILVTHAHADHVKSVGSFSHEYNVPVYTTRAVHAGIVANYCVQRKIPHDNVRVIQLGETFSLGDFRVTSFGVPHDIDNVGYFIECEGAKFCLLTDAGHVTDEIKTYIGRADYMVIEANHDEGQLKAGPYPEKLKNRILEATGHLSNRACAMALAENMSERLRHVWLCHLSGVNNSPDMARKTVALILRDHGIVVGADLQLDVLERNEDKKRNKVSEIFELVPQTDEGE